VGSLRFGVSRAHAGPKLVEGARLLAAALEGQLDTRVSLEIYDHYEEVLDAILKARLEMAWMPPLLHERAGAGGAHLVAVSQRGGALQFRSALLVRRESSFRELADLRGARAAWSDRHSASGHLYPKQHLGNLHLGNETIFGSPLEAMNAVLDGRADLCAAFVSDAAGRDRTLAENEIRVSFAPAADGLRVLDVTGAIPPDGIVVGAAVEPRERVRIAKALEKLHQAPAGKAALSVLMGAERLVISQVV
jgi:ABC-type phosphate/phosphonate transport system substrate-binding protein